MFNEQKKIGQGNRKSWDEAKLKRPSHMFEEKRMGLLMAVIFLECLREKGQSKGKGNQKQVKSKSTTVVEDTTCSEEEQMSIYDYSSDEEHETGSEKVSKSGDSQ
ncbi:hypothetical protein C0J52_26193 [Blattella germanica]|nr:hypothetical protein C0J52_26193 [Blattella germanica]